ncbi:Superoxide dismutase [Mn], mitochondrial [Cryptotrichosporon argae]
MRTVSSALAVARIAPAHAARALSLSAGARAKHTLPDLPYAYDALEPAISKSIMELHHKKHHQTYVTGLNAAEESLAKLQAASDVKGLIELQAALRFNGGGHM